MKKLSLYILFLFSFLFINNVYAIQAEYSYTLNGTTMNTSSRVYTAGNANITVLFKGDTNSPFNYNLPRPKYGYVALCSSSGRYDNRYVNTVSSGSFSHLTVVNSSVACNIPGTSAYKNTARVLYFTFEVPQSLYYIPGGGADSYYLTNNVGFAFYQPGSTEYTLVSSGFSNEPYNFNDTANGSDTIINQNDEIINQNNTQINQNNTIINQNTQINDNIQENSDIMTNDDVSDPSGTINSIKGNLATNGVITQLVVLPITLFQKILSSVNGTCTSYSLGSLYGHDLTLPCINVSSYIGSTLWGVIDVLISGLLVYSISKKMVKVFNHLSSMKEGDVLDD